MDITNEFLEELKVQFQNCEDWIDEWPNLWSLGPKGTGPNILVNHVHSLSSNFKSLSKSISSTRIDSKSFDSNTVRTNSSLSSILTVTSATTRIADGNMISNNQNVGTLASEMNKSTATAATATAVAVSGFEEENKSELSYLETMLEKYDKSIVSGFQVATSSGTLCNEPMMAVCFYLEDIDFKNGADSLESDRTFGPLSGQIISMVKDTCLESFDKSSRRLMEAMLKCEVVVGQQCIGKVYPILYKRRAVILKEDYEIGMDLFTISCLLPAVESFGFTSELRTKTSGLAQPFLLFSNWQLLDIDPYALPTTKEEIEEFGVYGEKKPNIAKQYIDSVRRRKGLLIKEKLVEFAEKQRTLSKKK